MYKNPNFNNFKNGKTFPIHFFEIDQNVANYILDKCGYKSTFPIAQFTKMNPNWKMTINVPNYNESEYIEYQNFNNDSSLDKLITLQSQEKETSKLMKLFNNESEKTDDINIEYEQEHREKCKDVLDELKKKTNQIPENSVEEPEKVIKRKRGRNRSKKFINSSFVVPHKIESDKDKLILVFKRDLQDSIINWDDGTIPLIEDYMTKIKTALDFKTLILQLGIYDKFAINTYEKNYTPWSVNKIGEKGKSICLAIDDFEKLDCLCMFSIYLEIMNDLNTYPEEKEIKLSAENFSLKDSDTSQFKSTFKIPPAKHRFIWNQSSNCWFGSGEDYDVAKEWVENRNTYFRKYIKCSGIYTNLTIGDFINISIGK
tara:strand:+ start:1315 stop:2427 length:1113 start_codon:yes stop_codon:yes gene_type:complete